MTKIIVLILIISLTIASSSHTRVKRGWGSRIRSAVRRVARPVVRVVKPVTRVVKPVVKVVKPVAKIVKPVVKVMKPVAKIVKPVAKVVDKAVKAGLGVGLGVGLGLGLPQLLGLRKPMTVNTVEDIFIDSDWEDLPDDLPSTGNSSYIVSPGYPNNYINNAVMDFPITVDEGKIIQLQFTNFSIEDSPSCAKDWVEIVDGDGTKLLNHSCGCIAPQLVTSKTNQIAVKFRSDGTGTEAGFVAHWRAVGQWIRK